MNKAELTIKLAIAKSNLKHENEVLLPELNNSIASYKADILNIHIQLADLNKAKTGRVKIGDEFKKGMEIFYINASGYVQCFKCGYSIDRNNLGREFYDRASAELFALREATEYKIWCEFGDDVSIVYNKWQCSDWSYKRVKFDTRMGGCLATENFLDTLSLEELNSIRRKCNE